MLNYPDNKSGTSGQLLMLTTTTTTTTIWWWWLCLFSTLT